MQHNNNRRCYQQSTTIAIACGYVLQADKKRGKNVMIFIASNMNEKFIKLTQLMTVRMQLIFFLLGIFNHPCENHFQLLNIQQLQKSASWYEFHEALSLGKCRLYAHNSSSIYFSLQPSMHVTVCCKLLTM